MNYNHTLTLLSLLISSCGFAENNHVAEAIERKIEKLNVEYKENELSWPYYSLMLIIKKDIFEKTKDCMLSKTNPTITDMLNCYNQAIELIKTDNYTQAMSGDLIVSYTMTYNGFPYSHTVHHNDSHTYGIVEERKERALINLEKEIIEMLLDLS